MAENTSLAHSSETNDAISDFSSDSQITFTGMNEILKILQQEQTDSFIKAFAAFAKLHSSNSKSSSISSPPKANRSKPEASPNNWVYTFKEVTKEEAFATSFKCPGKQDDLIKEGLFLDSANLIVKLQRFFVWCNYDKEELRSPLDSILFGTPYESKQYVVKSNDGLTPPTHTPTEYQPDAAGVFSKTEGLKYVVVPVTHVGKEEQNIEAIFIILKMEDPSSGKNDFICHVIYPHTSNNPFPPRQDDASPLSDEFEFIAMDIVKQSFEDVPDNLNMTKNIVYNLPYFLSKLVTKDYKSSKSFARNILNVGFLLLNHVLPSTTNSKTKYNQHQLLTVDYAASCKKLLLDETECTLNEHEKTAVVLFSLMSKSKHCLDKKAYRKQNSPKFEIEMTTSDDSVESYFSSQQGDAKQNFSRYLEQLEDLTSECSAFPFSTHLLPPLYLTPIILQHPTALTGDKNFNLLNVSASTGKRGKKNLSGQSEQDSLSMSKKPKSKQIIEIQDDDDDDDDSKDSNFI